MILLDTSTNLEIVLDSSPSTELDWNSVYIDTGDDSVGTSRGQTNGTTEVEIVPSPSSDKRLVKYLNIYNNNSSQVKVTIKTDDETNQRIFVTQLLDASNSLIYDGFHGWYIFKSQLIALDDLNDIDASSPSDGQALLYNSTSENGEAADITTSNDYVDSASGSGDGTLTLSRTDGVDVTADLSHTHSEYLTDSDIGTAAERDYTISTSDPSGGSDGDVGYKVE